MREYLFRGKRKGNGEWVEGSYLNIGGKEHYILVGKLDITQRGSILIEFPVDPETVGQYTGLRDNNGVKIFEGDIIRYGNSGSNLVYWDDDLSGFMELQIVGGNEYSCPLIVAEKSEVIGNIHDHPEMLKEGGEE